MSGMEPAVIAAMAPELLATSAAAAAPEVAMAALPAAGMTATGGLLGTGAGAFAGADALAGLGLGAEGLGGGMAMSAGLPASAAPFTATTMPSMAGSFGLGSASYGGVGGMGTGALGPLSATMSPAEISAMIANGPGLSGVAPSMGEAGLPAVSEAMGPPLSLWDGSSSVPMMDKLGYRGGLMMNNLKAGFTPEKMMMNGMKMAGQGLLGGQQQQMPHAMPSMQTGGDYRSLVPQSGGDYRKRRDELLKRMLGMQ